MIIIIKKGVISPKCLACFPAELSLLVLHTPNLCLAQRFRI